MEFISIWKMLETVANLILSSPFFIITLVVGILLLALMIYSIVKNKKMSKGLSIVVWIFLILFILIRYNNYLYSLFDNLINNIFVQIFFPNLATYIIMLISTITIMVYTIIKKSSPRFLKIMNVLFSFLIIFLFILTLDKIVNLNVNIYEQLTVFSDKELLILIELSMLIFVVWVLLLICIKIVRALIKRSNNKIISDFTHNKEDVESLEL